MPSSAADPQHAPDLCWRSQTGCHNLARVLPVADHAGLQSQALQVVDVGAGEDGLAQVFLFRRQQLDEEDPAQVACSSASVAALRQPCLRDRKPEQVFGPLGGNRT